MNSARIWISSLLWLSMLWLLPSQGFSLGVGGIKVKSSLNEPLSASIAIKLSGNEDFKPQDLKISLADAATHAQAGLLYPSVLQRARFDVLQSASGSVYVLINTTRPIQEPLINLLLKIRWETGQLIKEVSVFLDPPSYQRLPSIKAPARPTTIIASAPVSELSANTDAESILFSQGLPVFVEVPANMVVDSYRVTRHETRPRRTPQPRTNRRVEIIDSQYGPVRAGDTLNRIARVAARGTGLTEREMARAIYAANPEAFSGSIDRLNKGATLVIPGSTTAAATSPASSVTTGISSINELVGDLPSESFVERGKTVPAVNTKPSGSILEILPPDEASSRIARAMSEEYQRKTEEAAAKARNERANPSSGGTAGQQEDVSKSNATVASTGALSNSLNYAAPPKVPPALVPVETAGSNLVSPELAATKQALASTQEQLERLTLQLESLSQAQRNFQQSETSPLDTVVKWLPWLLLVLAVPLLILFGLRQRRPVEEPLLESPHQPHTNFTQVRDTEDVSHHNDVVASEFADSIFDEPKAPVRGEKPSINEFTSATVHLENPAEFADTSWDALPANDLAPSVSDTQETIRPPAIRDSKATQVVVQDDVLDESDAELDNAQEAEIYLAYGQLALAERTINKLVASHPDNDRYKLLELKLFAETGRMSDLQNLSVSLLGKYPSPESGVNQQVRKICDKAFQKQSKLDLSATPPIDTMAPTTHVDHLEASSDTLETPTTQSVAEVIYEDDISDYLHDEALAELSHDDPLAESFRTFDDATDADTRDTFDDLSGEELGDLSAELDLETPLETLELDEELEETYVDTRIEKFSDTDYRLNPLGHDLLAEKKKRHNKQSDREDHLELPFDLESEIEKLSKP